MNLNEQKYSYKSYHTEKTNKLIGFFTSRGNFRKNLQLKGSPDSSDYGSKESIP